MALQNLQYQKTFRNREEMIAHLNHFRMEVKPCVGMWYLSSGGNRSHPPGRHLPGGWEFFCHAALPAVRQTGTAARRRAGGCATQKTAGCAAGRRAEKNGRCVAGAARGYDMWKKRTVRRVRHVEKRAARRRAGGSAGWRTPAAQTLLCKACRQKFTICLYW